MAHVAAGNGSHVIDIDVERTDQPLPDQPAAVANHYHVIDVNVDTTAARPPELHECAVCMERLRWVAVGPCGHREVCSKCAVRIRSVDGNRLCCICRTPCPAVVVTGRSRAGDGKHIYNKVSSLTLAANEGRVGSYWYHKASASYFDDERPYNEATRTCSELERAEVGDEDENDRAGRSPVVIILVYLAINVAVFLGGSFGFVAMACIVWLLMECLRRSRRRQQ